jgi:HEAT repeat protein
MRALHAAAGILAAGLVLWAAPGRADTITNEDVVEMVKSGLAEKLIVTKIKTSTCRFDVSARKLVELKQANVPDAIIELMLEVQKEWLSRLKGAVQVALQGFRDPEAKQQERALRDLQRLGPDAIPEIAKQGLANETAAVRAGSVQAIGLIAHRDGLEPVMDMIVDREENVRAAAAKALKYVVEDGQKEAVFKRLSAITTDIEKPGDGAVLALGYLGDKRAVEDLRRTAKGDTSPKMRKVAVTALGELRDAASLELVISRLLEDRDGGVRAAAAMSLAKIGDAKAAPALIKAFERYPQERRHFVGPMAKFRDPAVVEVFIEALDDEDSAVKDLAWEGLKLLTGESLKKDRTVWSEWWELDGKKRF